MTAPSPPIPTFTDGATLTTQPLIDLGNTLGTLYSQALGGFRTIKPLAVVYRTLTPGAPSTGDEQVQGFDTVYANTDGMFGAIGGDYRFVIHTAGIYRLALQLHFDGAAGGVRACRIMVNGANPVSNSVAVDCRAPVTTREGTTLFCAALVSLGAGATVYAGVYQNSSGVSNVIPTFSGSFFSAEWVAPQ